MYIKYENIVYLRVSLNCVEEYVSFISIEIKFNLCVTK